MKVDYVQKLMQCVDFHFIFWVVFLFVQTKPKQVLYQIDAVDFITLLFDEPNS
jgi:hypothetical protein